MVDRTLDDAEGRSAAAPKAGPDPRRPPAWTDRVPDLLASYLAAVATFCAVTALLPVLREPLAWLRTAIEIVSVGAPPSLATAAFLGILAAAVRRRMRAAWWFVVLYLVLGRILGWITVLIDTDAQDPVVVSAGSGVLAWLRVGFGVAGLVLLLVARKCLRPLPDKRRGLCDPEARVRQRYLDLVVNPDARTQLAPRSRADPRRARQPRRPRLPRGGDADAADDPRRGQRPPVPHPHQRLRPRPVPADRAGALPQAADGRRHRARSSRSAATSATRAPTPRTTPSSPCSRRTRRTATTPRCGR